jgi:hypothetical protein
MTAENRRPIVAILGTAIVALAHGLLCFRLCTTMHEMGSPWPFLSDDHTLHFSNALVTRHFLADSGLNTGFDPSFLAGYYKSTYWPTNPLLEISMYLKPVWIEPAFTYKLFAFKSVMLLPIAVGLSSWILGLSSRGTIISALLAVLIYWHHWPFHTVEYFQYGMTAFVYSVSLTLFAGAWASRWLKSGSWASACCFGVASALALMAHPTAAVTLGPPVFAAWLAQAWRKPVRGFLQLILAAAICLAANCWWLVPLVIFRDTLGPSPDFFNNPNVMERLADFFKTEDHPFLPRTIPLLTWVLAAALLNGFQRGGVMVLGMMWIFVLAIPAGAVQQFGPLQLGRNTLLLMVWICPACGDFLSRCMHSFTGRLLLVGLVGFVGFANGPRLHENIRQVIFDSVRVTSAELPPAHRSLLAVLKDRAAGSRVLFEAFEDRNPKFHGGTNPFGSVRLAPLVPIIAGVHCVGGPYLATHYRANFANCGDGMLFDRTWDQANFDELARVYALDWAVLWSPSALAYARKNPNQLKPDGAIGGLHLFRIVRSASAWEKAGITMEVRPNRIAIHNPRKARGTFVLPYHFHPGWDSEPKMIITGTRQGDDPEPFITIIDPPESVEMKFSPWQALSRSLKSP